MAFLRWSLWRLTSVREFRGYSSRAFWWGNGHRMAPWETRGWTGVRLKDVLDWLA